jgi:hypothetical protein
VPTGFGATVLQCTESSWEDAKHLGWAPAEAWATDTEGAPSDGSIWDSGMGLHKMDKVGS